MWSAGIAVLALAVAVVQLGAVPSLFLDPAAAPLLPVALIAAWAAARDGSETWPAWLIAPFALGVASEERVGWFMIALLPTVSLALAAGRFSGARRFAIAPAAAGAGALIYLVLLTVAAGRASALPSAATAHLVAALWTAGAAGLLAIVFWPLRPRTHGLFE